MLEFESILDKMESRYRCSLATIASVAGIASAVGGIASAVSGGGSGGGEGGVAAPSSQINVASQTPLQNQDSQAAKTYDPSADAQRWISLFNNMPEAKDQPIAGMPSIQISQDNVNVNGSTQSS